MKFKLLFISWLLLPMFNLRGMRYAQLPSQAPINAIAIDSNGTTEATKTVTTARRIKKAICSRNCLAATCCLTVTAVVVASLYGFYEFENQKCVNLSDNTDITDSNNCYAVTVSNCGTCNGDEISDKVCHRNDVITAGQLKKKISDQFGTICGGNTTYCIDYQQCEFSCSTPPNCPQPAPCNPASLSQMQSFLEDKCRVKGPQSLPPKAMNRGNKQIKFKGR